MDHTFHRLAPFIQEYIYTHNWTELRPVQMEACRVIFNTKAHLLLPAGTASGKTEAAFLPILTVLHENPPATVGVLYISPIKALINDQFERLSEVLRQSDTSVWAWHGDIASSRKRQLLKNPQGILQITPESLESLLINRNNELPRLFGDLRFIVIDEIHAFMGSERGRQILCQLARLSHYTKNLPRRVGLSATLGDYTLAESWLRSQTNLPVITPQIQKAQKQVHLSLECFHKDNSHYYRYVYERSQSRKCLIFTNNRTESELIIANLRSFAQAKGSPDIYHVHHGSVSALLRDDAERAMRTATPAVIAATVTLEMGIDIGELERVIQINAPVSVSSFLQRLGRTGRRGTPADMRFVCTDGESPEQIPWQLLQCIAIIQLYLEERWIEPIAPIQYPFSLLYHQTMSILASQGELSPAALTQQVLSLPAFAAISPTDFRQLLRYLISIDHLQAIQGKLMIGLGAEKLVRNFHFYAVFSETVEYCVKGETGEIGKISIPPSQGQRFALAGRTWEVVDLDASRKTVFVKLVEGIAGISWRGSRSASIHTKILQRMRQVLLENVQYPYLQKGASKRLNSVRQQAKRIGLATQTIVPLATENRCTIFPWVGTVAFDTLERLLHLIREELDIQEIDGQSPYYLTVKLGQSAALELQERIVKICQKRLTTEDLVAPDEAPKRQKYDRFIPNHLLRKAFACDCLNLEELASIVQNW
ncbi:MAG: DEAD/DEAH box helicase [Cyanophyceae cyanobacterium]